MTSRSAGKIAWSTVRAFWVLLSLIAIGVDLSQPDSVDQASALVRQLQDLGLGWAAVIVDSKAFYVFVGVGTLFLVQFLIKLWRNPTKFLSEGRAKKIRRVRIWLRATVTRVESIILGVPITYYLRERRETGAIIRSERVSDATHIRVRSGRSRLVPRHFPDDARNWENCHICFRVRGDRYILEFSSNGKPVVGATRTHCDYIESTYEMSIDTRRSILVSMIKVTPIPW